MPDRIMTDKELEGNEKIAKFLGWPVCHCGTPTRKHYKWGKMNWEVVEVKEMKFHSSFDELRPVIDKIMEYTLVHPDQTKKIRDCSVIIKIEVLFEYVVEFINFLEIEEAVFHCPKCGEEIGPIKHECI